MEGAAQAYVAHTLDSKNCLVIARSHEVRRELCRLLSLDRTVDEAGHEAGDVAVITVMALLVVGRHLSNLRRLVKGQELGLESNQSDEPPDLGDERAAS